MNNFDESKHPRAKDGKFASSDGFGGEHEATKAEKRRMSEMGINDGSGKDKKAQAAAEDKTTIKEQVRAAQDKLKNTNVLMVISKAQMATDFKTAVNALKEELSKNNGVVSRKDFGDVQVGARLKKAGAYIKSPAEIAAIFTVPTIIKHGVLLGVHERHKGREYATYTFAGKVSIGKQEGVVAVVVKKTTGNFYKVHRVLTPDGKDIEIKNDTD